jgi:thiol-disulfide isomerase/thioredoxin
MLIAFVAAVVIGQPLPPLEVTSLTGERVTLAPRAGRALVIDLFATWCGPCRDSMPELERLRRRFGDRIDFVSIAEEEDRKTVQDFVTLHGLGSRVLLDGDRSAYGRLGAHRLPTTYVVDGKGIVHQINHGHGPGYEARLARWLSQLAARP